MALYGGYGYGGYGYGGYGYGGYGYGGYGYGLARPAALVSGPVITTGTAANNIPRIVGQSPIYASPIYQTGAALVGPAVAGPAFGGFGGRYLY